MDSRIEKSATNNLQSRQLEIVEHVSKLIDSYKVSKPVDLILEDRPRNQVQDTLKEFFRTEEINVDPSPENLDMAMGLILSEDDFRYLRKSAVWESIINDKERGDKLQLRFYRALKGKLLTIPAELQENLLSTLRLYPADLEEIPEVLNRKITEAKQNPETIAA